MVASTMLKDCAMENLLVYLESSYLSLILKRGENVQGSYRENCNGERGLAVAGHGLRLLGVLVQLCSVLCAYKSGVEYIFCERGLFRAGFPVGGVRGEVVAGLFLLNRPDFEVKAGPQQCPEIR